MVLAEDRSNWTARASCASTLSVATVKASVEPLDSLPFTMTSAPAAARCRRRRLVSTPRRWRATRTNVTSTTGRVTAASATVMPLRAPRLR